MGYLRLCPAIGITYGRPDKPEDLNQLFGAADASFGGNRLNLKSMYGFYFWLNKGPIMIKCGRQSMIAHSTAMSEYYAYGESGKFAQYMVNYMKAIDCRSQIPIHIYEDSTACISIATNPINTSLTRSWAIRLHVARDLTMEGIILPVWIESAEQAADIFTKALPKQLHRKHRAKLMNCPLKPKCDGTFDAASGPRVNFSD
jgi:hypothetical protein